MKGKRGQDEYGQLTKICQRGSPSQPGPWVVSGSSFFLSTHFSSLVNYETQKALTASIGPITTNWNGGDYSLRFQLSSGSASGHRLLLLYSNEDQRKREGR